MRIFAVDPGTLVTGYAVVEVVDGKYQTIDYGCVRPPQKYKLSERYLIIFESIDALLAKYEPECFVVETQYVKYNVQTAIKLGMARGAVVIAAARRGIKIYEYAPSQAKLAVVGHGQASKAQVQGMIQLLLQLREVPEDAADALALALCHAQAAHAKKIIMQEV